MKSEVFGVALFGAPYLYQSRDPYFHLKMKTLGLRRGSPLICGLRHKAILAKTMSIGYATMTKRIISAVDSG